jgi:hypothetical protein
MTLAAMRLVLHSMKAATSSNTAAQHSDTHVHAAKRDLRIVTGHAMNRIDKSGSTLQPCIIDMLQQLGISCHIDSKKKVCLLCHQSSYWLTVLGMINQLQLPVQHDTAVQLMGLCQYQKYVKFCSCVKKF